jgi:hypothetical protein
MQSKIYPVAAMVLVVAAAACESLPRGVETDPAVGSQSAPRRAWDDEVDESSRRMHDEGKEIFRRDTFGSEAFWGGELGLHEAIAGEEHGGVGPGLSPRQALALGLKADVGALPRLVIEVLKGGAISFDDPETTLELLRARAVVGVEGVFDEQDELVSVGITCALCHSTVDDSLMKGIGRRLDGWPNRDLDIGSVAALAPSLEPFAEILGVDEATVRTVLHSWGPGKYDSQLNLDGKAFRPDGRSGAVLLPAAYGLAGVNLHTYTGFGSVPYWNAYVANLQMYGRGTFFDPRLADAEKFPIAARNGFWDVRGGVLEPGGADEVTSKLAALHVYQLAIPAPTPPEGSYDVTMAGRGEQLFATKARCATCHVPPLFTEPGHALHSAEELGIDDFQASRSPEGKYRTTPLRGLFARAKGGFYHDGRFGDYRAVIEHYQRVFALGLSEGEMRDLEEYLKSL